MSEFFGKRLRYIQEVKRDERGFTLIELLVVVIIIGILAAIAIPVFLSQRTNAQDRAAQANLRTAASAQQGYATQNGTYTTVTADLTNWGFPTGGTPAVTVPSASATAYCMQSTSASNAVFSITQASQTPVTGACGGT